MTAEELCNAGEKYACEILAQMNGDTPQAIAIMVAIGAVLLTWLVWTTTH